MRIINEILQEKTIHNNMIENLKKYLKKKTQSYL